MAGVWGCPPEYIILGTIYCYSCVNWIVQSADCFNAHYLTAWRHTQITYAHTYNNASFPDLAYYVYQKVVAAVSH